MFHEYVHSSPGPIAITHPVTRHHPNFAPPGQEGNSNDDENPFASGQSSFNSNPNIDQASDVIITEVNNAPLIVVQRYNRPRLLAIIERGERT